MNTKVTTGGRVVIPAALRRQLNILPGTRIHIELDAAAQRLVLTPITPAYVRSLRGKYRGRRGLDRLLAARRQDREREDRPRTSG